MIVLSNLEKEKPITTTKKQKTKKQKKKQKKIDK